MPLGGLVIESPDWRAEERERTKQAAAEKATELEDEQSYPAKPAKRAWLAKGARPSRRSSTTASTPISWCEEPGETHTYDEDSAGATSHL